jgi:ubiquinone/menaquinone biosynthesis C-methylase UbiE
MNIKFIGNFLRKLVTKREEVGEYSSGYWPNKIREKVLKIISKKGKILEVGCGEGLFLDVLSKVSPDLEIVGVDNWDEILNKTKERLKERKNVSLIKADGTNLPFEDNTFDTVVCVNVLLNISDFETVSRILKEMLRVCKLDGKIFFDIRNKRSPIFKIQYKFVKYYDPDIKVPLNTYNIEDFNEIVNIKNLHYIGFPKNKFAPIIIVEAMKRSVKNG